MFSWLKNLLDRLFAVGGALLFTQLPLFMQQYTQMLSGHTAELLIQVEHLKEAASYSGKNLSEYTAKFLSSSDPDFSKQGEILTQMIQRSESMQTALHDLQTTPAYLKPLYFIRYVDSSIVKATIADYTPGFPLNWEGLIYAFIGLLFGYSVFAVLAKILSIFGWLIPWRKKEPTIEVDKT